LILSFKWAGPEASRYKSLAEHHVRRFTSVDLPASARSVPGLCRKKKMLLFSVKVGRLLGGRRFESRKEPKAGTALEASGQRSLAAPSSQAANQPIGPSKSEQSELAGRRPSARRIPLIPLAITSRPLPRWQVPLCNTAPVAVFPPQSAEVFAGPGPPPPWSRGLCREITWFFREQSENAACTRRFRRPGNETQNQEIARPRCESVHPNSISTCEAKE